MTASWHQRQTVSERGTVGILDASDDGEEEEEDDQLAVLNRTSGTSEEAWCALHAQREDLFRELSLAARLRPTDPCSGGSAPSSAPATGSAPAKAHLRCRQCGSRGLAGAMPIREDLPHPGSVLLQLPGSCWHHALRAMRTPHCSSCGTVSFAPVERAVDKVQQIVARARLAGQLRLNVELQPCACCRVKIASDALACPRCGTTSPRGGLLTQPRLQRCARCGGEVASDAGLCVHCGTATYTPAGLFSSGPKDLRLVSCPDCGRLVAADALLCVRCGSSWHVPSALACSSGSGHCSSSSDCRLEGRYVNASEASVLGLRSVSSSAGEKSASSSTTEARTPISELAAFLSSPRPSALPQAPASSDLALKCAGAETAAGQGSLAGAGGFFDLRGRDADHFAT
eukprot:TRINITY_DN21196_c0_g1_i2.p1 TRINITY_DN21196_c0_g1~~TRINITY_DN21196_c0_g1_i2.p1  ORF type:complete len:400 (-),score=48.06 TRINITY_DN21196_c0_g1_i2:11-1210(-)